jgi:hypothetical protein
MSTPVSIDRAFEEEARAMAKAMETGELPPTSASYYALIKKLAEMHWSEQERRRTKGGGHE